MIISGSNISMSSGRKFMEANTLDYEFDGTNSFLNTMHREVEHTNFKSQGQVNTTDGRQINMDISLTMERSETTFLQSRQLYSGGDLMDPLVINTGFGITRISDKKFKFDLDSDGEEESISTLGKGSGFLAYDKNEDGVINNGLELFGAVTGDGFSELAEYDYDKNGWIDEADEIFQKLKVWFKNEDGTDELVSLKEAGIGAIYLGCSPTEFSEKGAERLNGVIRSTGIFLGEDGEVGTVMHIDLVAEKPEALGGKDGLIGDSADGEDSFAEPQEFGIIGVKYKNSKRAIIDYIEKLREQRKKMLEEQLAKTQEKRRDRADFFRQLLEKKYSIE